MTYKKGKRQGFAVRYRRVKTPCFLEKLPLKEGYKLKMGYGGHASYTA